MQSTEHDDVLMYALQLYARVVCGRHIRVSITTLKRRKPLCGMSTALPPHAVQCMYFA
jgi:hypothetical protein